MRRSSRKFAWTVALALCISTGMAQGTAWAQATVEEEGAIVALDNEDLIVDLGSLRGAESGQTVELWRPVKLKHPVTGRLVADRFRIGTLKLGQVRKNIALARPEGALLRAPLAGDVVILVRAKPESKPIPQPKADPKKPGEPPATDSRPEKDKPRAPGKDAEEDPEAVELSELFTSLRGADLVARIRKYEDLVRKNPKGKFAVVLYEEAQSLRKLLDAPSASDGGKGGPKVLGWEIPKGVEAGAGLSVGIEMVGVLGGVLHVKKRGAPQYTSIPLAAAGKGYWTAAIPAEEVAAPGVDLFVEGTTADGKVVAVVAAADKPQMIDVEERPVVVAARRELSASMWTDYAHYNNPAKNNDYLSQTEAFFGTRFSDVGIRAVRSGFGVYRGASGSIKDLDVEKKDPRAVGLTYGYVELEYAPATNYAFIGRAAVGLDDAGVSGGAQAFVRVGNDKKTNLLLGGEALGGIGVRGIVQLEWRTIPRVPILLRTEVTNQPAGVRGVETPAIKGETPKSAETSEVGARAIVQVGYQFTRNVEASIRVSYQGRTINHAGPGAGAGVTYTW